MGHNKIQKFQLLGCVNFCICHYFHEKSTILKLVLTYDFYSLFWYLVWILALKWLDSKSLVLWPSESPSYDYMHWKFLIFIQSTYFSHLMITSCGAVQFSKTVVTLAFTVQFSCNSTLKLQFFSLKSKKHVMALLTFKSLATVHYILEVLKKLKYVLVHQGAWKLKSVKVVNAF